MMRKLRLIILAALTLLFASSCHYKELCMDHWEHASRYDIRLEADYELKWEYSSPERVWKTLWPGLDFDRSYESFLPETPEGLRAVIYSEGQMPEIRNIDAHGGLLPLRAGRQNIILFNNDTEYIVFNDLTQSAQARATTRTRTRSTYKGSPFTKSKSGELETTVNTPDHLFGHYIKEYDTQRLPEAPTVKVTMKPLVFTYYIRCKFSYGLEYVALMRGALAGMAGSVYLTDGHTGGDIATVLFDGELLDGFGVTATVNSFGAPNYPNPEYSKADAENLYGLNIELRLKNGRLKSFDFDLTKQMASQPRGGVIQVDGLFVTDEEGKEASGTFDVDVSDWGEYVDVPMVF